MNADPSTQVDLLRWWHQHQTQMLKHEADLIRNGVLQDMFAMRRQLELSPHHQTSDYLAEIKRIYTLLENLSNRLDPPYFHDSLPLALQHTARTWKSRIHFSTILPKNWEPEPPEQRRLLILFCTNLLQQIATAERLPKHCSLTLQHQSGKKELTFQFQYKELLPPSLTLKVASALQPFLDTFQLFTQGAYYHDAQSQSLNWLLCWTSQSQSQSFLIPSH